MDSQIVLESKVGEYKHKSIVRYLSKDVKNDEELKKENFETCLSPFFEKLICSDEAIDSNKKDSRIISKDGFLDLSFFKDDTFFSDKIKTASLARTNLEFFAQAMKDRKEVMQNYKECFEFLHGIDLGNIGNDLITLFFLSESPDEHPSFHKKDLMLLIFAAICGILEKLLTAVLRAKLKDALKPFVILSEVLGHPGLLELLDERTISFFKACVGNPEGLNMRNIIWHGFISPNFEFDDRFTSLIFIILFSVVKKIINSPYKNLQLNWKIPKKFSFEEKFENLFRILKKDERKEIFSIVDNSKFVFFDRKSLVRLGIDLFLDFESFKITEKSKNYFFLCGILPLIEHFLRLQFVVKNDLDESMLFAKTTELFTTLDVIFCITIKKRMKKETKIEDSEDAKVENLYLDQSISIWEDLLVWEDGYRVRDAVAHLEMNPSSIPNEVTSFVFSSFLYTSLKNSFSSNFQNDSSLSKLLKECFENYQTKFHPMKLLFSEMNKIFEEIKEFEDNFITNLEKDDLEMNSKVPEIKGYECQWNESNFAFTYAKLKDGPKKEGVLFYEDVIKIAENSLKDFKDEKIIKDFDQNEKIDLSAKKKLQGEVAIFRKTLNEAKRIPSALLSKSEMYTLIREKKARTKNRKSFGVVVKTKKFFTILMKILVLKLLSYFNLILQNLNRSEKEYEVIHEEVYDIFCACARFANRINDGETGTAISDTLKWMKIDIKKLKN